MILRKLELCKFIKAKDVKLTVVFTPNFSDFPCWENVLKVVQKQLQAYLNIHDFITPDQSAFVKDHATVTALHKVTDNWLKNIEE